MKKGELFQGVNSKRVPNFGAKMHPLCTHLQNFAKIWLITWGKGQNSILKKKESTPYPPPPTVVKALLPDAAVHKKILSSVFMSLPL